MTGYDLRELWRSGKPSFGAWVSLADTAVAGILANIGFDWTVIDTEHFPFNPETLRNIIILLKYLDATPIVRIRANDAAIVKQVLDWGAEGVIFPMSKDAEDARNAVAACRYPPMGIRGFNPREASDFGKHTKEYFKSANERMLSILLIELKEAVENIDEILEVPGIDSIMLGPSDLSISLGVPNDFSSELLQKNIRTVIQKANNKSIPVGMAWFDTALGYQKYLELGLNWILLGSELDFIRASAEPLLRRLRSYSEKTK